MMPNKKVKLAKIFGVIAAALGAWRFPAEEDAA